MALWLEALNEPLGIYIRTPDPPLLVKRLYLARDRCDVGVKPLIAHLQLRTSPRDPKGELWIVNPAPRGTVTGPGLGVGA